MHLFSDSQSVITLGVHIMVAMLISSLSVDLQDCLRVLFKQLGKLFRLQLCLFHKASSLFQSSF